MRWIRTSICPWSNHYGGRFEWFWNWAVDKVHRSQRQAMTAPPWAPDIPQMIWIWIETPNLIVKTRAFAEKRGCKQDVKGRRSQVGWWSIFGWNPKMQSAGHRWYALFHGSRGPRFCAHLSAFVLLAPPCLLHRNSLCIPLLRFTWCQGGEEQR